MRVLVTGGAGYIGSVVSESLLHNGHEVTVLDTLQRGRRAAVPAGAQLVVGSMGDAGTLEAVFRRRQIEAVMHLAGASEPHDPVNPARHFREDVGGGLTLLAAMLRHGVNKLVFASSAAVYGSSQGASINEDDPLQPVTPCGDAKLVFERALHWYGQAYGLKHIALRYFNVAGATRMHGEDHNPETHLIPRILKAALLRDRAVEINGSDYETDDGSCVRDYAHVSDIAAANLLALEKIEDLSGEAYNLGNGVGRSVLQVVAAAARVTGARLVLKFRGRRPGDAASVVADVTRVRTELGWQPRYTDVHGIIDSAWAWMKAHPAGYSAPVRVNVIPETVARAIAAGRA